jgi:crotonobetainyl-CoA:carnitine CoA-transferase CaiB-like acyl-CoA transferase
MLSKYRVLDLADDRGIFSGRILGDMGADVIKVEPLWGDPARRIGPFYHDETGIESSLFWQIYATNKRSVTLDIGAAAARDALLKLVASSDFLIESFRPGYLEGLGLGYESLRTLNPRLIYVSITPFGQFGPYRDYSATDITGMALSGFMHLTGDEDRPPVRVSVPQFWLLGAASATAGAMIAHQHRASTGLGQHVDASCQQAAARTLSHAPQYWDLSKINLKRQGPFRPIGEGRALRVNWECADGYVNFIQPGSVVGGRNMKALCAWMDEEGFGDAELSAIDFGAIGFGQITTEQLGFMNRGLGRFFASKTKKSLAAGALERRVLLFPVNDPADVFAYPQLAARGYFQDAEAPGGGTYVTLGSFIRASASPLTLRRRAPRLGEHRDEVLAEAGITADEISGLRATGVA